jgi:hypothetical protein
VHGKDAITSFSLPPFSLGQIMDNQDLHTHALHPYHVGKRWRGKAPRQSCQDLSMLMARSWENIYLQPTPPPSPQCQRPASPLTTPGHQESLPS